MRTLEARITGITPAAPLLGIDAGPAALKTFVAALPESAEGEGNEKGPDLDALTVIAAEADSALARAEGVDEAASTHLRELEARNAPLMVQAAGAERDAANAVAQLAALDAKPEVVRLDEALSEARQREAEALVNLQDAERAATAHESGEGTVMRLDPIANRSEIHVRENYAEVLEQVNASDMTLAMKGFLEGSADDSPF